MSNPYETMGREKKARRLALKLRAAGAHSTTIGKLPDGPWMQAATLAGVKVPSAETRLVVAMVLREMESQDAAIQEQSA